LAVDAVSNPPIVTEPQVSEPDGGTPNYNSMTAAEILDAYNNKGLAVPKAVLEWAQFTYKNDPQSKVTYGESGDNGETDGNDAISYQLQLEEEGTSLKEQCKIFTELSAQKEERDLQNITKIAPYAQSILQGEFDGDTGESAVEQLFNEIRSDMNAHFILSGKGREDIKFFNAFSEGTLEDISTISDDLETMQAELAGTIAEAKDSKQHGEVTVALGKELKGHRMSLFSRKARIGKRAINQGEKTIEMATKTDKFASAIAKDNNIAIESLKKNQDNIDNTGTTGGEAGAGGEPAGGTGGATGGGETPA